ncbi:unnamed protein product [Symbiodinium sp. CCMP2592]|nr:unnamed protein product [Symbiodinium sp. CCMP2592]
MKRPIFDANWTGNLKRQAAEDLHDDVAFQGQNTSAPTSSCPSQLSQSTALPIKNDMSRTLQQLGEPEPGDPDEAAASDKQEKFEEKQEVQNRDCEACIQYDAQQPPQGQPQQTRKKDLAAASILELLRSGHFVNMARNLEKEIGIQDSQ